MNSKVEIIVIGGGVIGCALTYYLAKYGAKVLLLERKDLLNGSAGATDGVVGYHTKKPGYHLELALKSGALYDTLEEELGSDIAYQKDCGGLQPIEDNLQWEILEAGTKAQRQAGVDVRMLSIEEARAIEPNLSPNLLGALYCPTSGQVNPLKLTLAFAKKAKALGAVIQTETCVQGIITKAGRVVGVSTNRGESFADYIIDAGGSWAAEIAAMAGVSIPIKPRRGQLIVTEPVAPFIHTTVVCARYNVIKFRPETIQDETVLRLGSGLSFEQTEDGSLIIGSTREMAGFDKGNTFEAIEAILKRAVKFFPGIREMHFIRCFSGLRPFTPDGLPIIGEVTKRPGLILCAGHEGDGIALAPITGKLLAEQLVYGKPSYPLSPFLPERFLS